MKSNMLMAIVLMCALTGLIILTAALPAQASHRSEQSAYAAPAPQDHKVMVKSEISWNPFKWIWSTIKSLIVPSPPAAGGDGGPVVNPPGLYGGDDGFTHSTKQ
jgi:hypothetical protein